MPVILQILKTISAEREQKLFILPYFLKAGMVSIILKSAQNPSMFAKMLF